jgi:cytochrome c
MQKVPLAGPNDMRSLVGYVWNLQFQETGDATKGAKTFRDKKCAGCHQNMARGERVFTPYTMVTLWWQHGSLMQADMEKTKTRWPVLEADDVLDIVAYLNKKQ